MDESGSLGFSSGGTQYFILALISPDSGKRLNKCIKNINAHLIGQGWNPDVEIKASNLWHSPRHEQIPATYKYKDDPSVPMERILRDIAKVDGYIEFAVIKLDTVSVSLKSSPYGILYNYFSWLLLKGPLCYFPAVGLFVDRRNRENHNLLKFDGYVEGKTVEARSAKGKPPLKLRICHYHAKSAQEHKAEERAQVEFGIRGIEAADFICWAIKRKYEDGNDRWYSLIEKRIKWKQELFFESAETAKKVKVEPIGS